MLELIAQGKTSHDRWRKVLLQKLPFALGRTSKDWATQWDEKISREHARLQLEGETLQIARVSSAANPIYFQGQEQDSFSIRAGEHFVIGDTTFLLTNAAALPTLELPSPISQRAFTHEYLKQVRYRDADHRIDVLNRLPEIISRSNNDAELHGQMVNLLLSGMTSSTVVAICRQTADGVTDVIHWDQRNISGGDFEPCARLIAQSLERDESTLHMWRTTDDAKDFAVDMINDWAFVCPLAGPSTRGWAIYVTGVNRNLNPDAALQSDEMDLHGDVKFAELVGATLANLKRVQQLERRQSTFRPFFSPVVMEAFVDRDPEEVLKPRQCEISVLFCDLRGFSAKSEQMSDELEELLDRVSQALGIMTHNVLDFGGVIGDFHGDAAMGFWGWPLDKKDAVENVCRAALNIQAELASIAAQPEHRLHDFQMGIGVATGNAVAGKIGTSHQVKVTAFGPVVNLAARLEGMTRLLNIPILIDGASASRLKLLGPESEAIATPRRLGLFRPFGLKVACDVYQLVPPHEMPSQQLLQCYTDCLNLFAKGQWEEALEQLSVNETEDVAARFLADFIRNREQPPNFDGVIDLESK